MRIRSFCKFVEVECLNEYTLNNSTVIIDGQNFFHRFYKMSGLQYIFGCESDRFAKFLREQLRRFQLANVQCYFIFKGGHEDFNKRLNCKKTDALSGRDFVIGNEYNVIVQPIFMKEVIHQVLDEMGFNYTFCKFESKKECIAFAQKHNYPVISYDIEYCFAGVKYIPYTSIKFNEQTNTLTSGLFTLDDFLKKFRLTEENLLVFVAITDESHFPEMDFEGFLKKQKINTGFYKRFSGILYWLARTTRENAINQIFRSTSPEDKAKFLEVETKVRDFLRRQETPGTPTEYLKNGNKIEISENDPNWFEKGIAMKHIPASATLVNLVTTNMFLGSWAIADKKDDDALLLSVDIIKYTYNLLTNFEKQEIVFMSDNKTIPMTVTAAAPGSVQKPDYDAVCSPFENGWDRLQTGLFQHFINETLQGFNFEGLEKLPDDSKLLMIALIYYSRKKPADTANEVYSVLLSYTALSVLFINNDKNNNLKVDLTQKPIIDSITDKKIINEADKCVATALLQEYTREVGVDEAKVIFEPKLLHPLVEFQHCLTELNNLNTLCGSPYKPTIYSNTYNGTFVYKVVRAIKYKHHGNGLMFLKMKLNPAPTVLAFMIGLIELYEELLY